MSYASKYASKLSAFLNERLTVDRPVTVPLDEVADALDTPDYCHSHKAIFIKILDRAVREINIASTKQISAAYNTVPHPRTHRRCYTEVTFSSVPGTIVVEPEAVVAEPDIKQEIIPFPAAASDNPAVTVFENPEFGKVRVVEKDGEPWFVANDVCRILNISNTKDGMKTLDDDEKTGVDIIDPHGRTQNTNAISEPGLYSLVLRSRKPEAKAFKRWITHDVIPSIRKHGAYMTRETLQKSLSSPEALIEILTALKNEQEKSVELARRNTALIQENTALAAKRLEWDKRHFILAAVRRLSTTIPCGVDPIRFARAWGMFKRELLYRESVNLELRLTNLRKQSTHPSQLKLIDAIDPEIEDAAVSTITALCKERELDISDLLANIPA